MFAITPKPVTLLGENREIEDGFNYCLQYVIGAIFRDIHIWSATGESGAVGSGYSSVTAGHGGGSGDALATLPTSVGVVTDFFVGPGHQVG